ncbi:MAG: hypothetical protein CXT73_07320, partial [Methanobacteriota archaeon]
MNVGDIYQFYVRSVNPNIILGAAKGILIEIDDSPNRAHRMKIVEPPMNYPINEPNEVNRFHGTIMKWDSTILENVKIGKLPSIGAGGRKKRTRKKRGGNGSDSDDSVDTAATEYDIKRSDLDEILKEAEVRNRAAVFQRTAAPGEESSQWRIYLGNIDNNIDSMQDRMMTSPTEEERLLKRSEILK